MSVIPNIIPNRNKIIEAIVYFSKALKYPSKMMIYKVLAELDYRHFLETGLPVTNLEYFAWKWGPVPKDFDKEISDRKQDIICIPKDFTNSIYVDTREWVNKKTGEDCKMFLFKSKRKPNLEIFSPRQKKILDQVAAIYKDATPTQASQASHEKDKPWQKTIALKGREGDLIDFFEILPKNSKIDKDEAKERLNEILAFTHNYKA